MPKKAKVYFPGLHGLRFFAAMMVVFSHVELMKDYHGYPNLYASNLAVYESGRMGVTLFFVLSGFLISYLLLTEKKITGSISVKKFYGRRILRIWPLYYLLVILTFIVLPRIGFFAVPNYSAAMPTYFWYTFPFSFSCCRNWLSAFSSRCRLPSLCGLSAWKNSSICFGR
jgi:peptidoglycan/LPS O-acetylase OafA/YrhL